MAEVIIYWVSWVLAVCFNFMVVVLVFKLILKPDNTNIKIYREEDGKCYK